MSYRPMTPQEMDEWDEREEQLVRGLIPDPKYKRDLNDKIRCFDDRSEICL